MHFLKSGPFLAVGGFILGVALTIAVLGRYHQFGKSSHDFTLMDRLTGKLYYCLGGECEAVQMREK